MAAGRAMAPLFVGVLIVGAANAGAIRPAFKWAQSPSDLHVYVKFAHKIDAPAYNNFAQENVKVTLEEDRVTMVASNDEKKFEFDIELLKSIIVDESSYSIHTFGVSMVLKKRDKVWKRLMKDRKLKPRNMHIWWELYEKYNDEMEKLLAEDDNSKSGQDKKWWKGFEHKCAACQIMIKEAAFTNSAIKKFELGIKEEEERIALEEEERKKKEAEGKTEEEGESEKKKKSSHGNTLQMAQGMVKKVCEGYPKSLSPQFKKACKKLRKKRDLKNNFLVTIGAVIEMIKKNPGLKKERLKPRFIAKQTERACASAGVCPRIPSKISTCKACTSVVTSFYGVAASLRKQPPVEDELFEDLCENISLYYTPAPEEVQTLVSSTCATLVSDWKSDLMESLSLDPAYIRKELKSVCRSAGFCEKKKKKVKSKKENSSDDEAPKDEL